MPLTKVPSSMLDTVDGSKIVNATVSQSKLAQNVGATGPAFYAYASTGTAMAANAQTKINFQVEDYDTNNNFDTSTSRFQPTIAGYYELKSTVRYDVSGNVVTHTYINHNRLGTIGTGSFFSTTQNQAASHASTTAYFNGTTDYVEIAVYVNLSGTTMAGRGVSYFTGTMVRAA